MTLIHVNINSAFYYRGSTFLNIALAIILIIIRFFSFCFGR